MAADLAAGVAFFLDQIKVILPSGSCPLMVCIPVSSPDEER